MALELFMVGLIVHDMPTAPAFYSRFSLAIPFFRALSFFQGLIGWLRSM